MTVAPDILIKNLSDQAADLFRSADAAEAVARYFRPAYEACWDEDKPVDKTDVLALRPYVIEQEAQARFYKKLAQQLLEAIDYIRKESS
jgi:hypothetical protein